MVDVEPPGRVEMVVLASSSALVAASLASLSSWVSFSMSSLVFLLISITSASRASHVSVVLVKPVFMSASYLVKPSTWVVRAAFSLSPLVSESYFSTASRCLVSLSTSDFWALNWTLHCLASSSLTILSVSVMFLEMVMDSSISMTF